MIVLFVQIPPAPFSRGKYCASIQILAPLYDATISRDSGTILCGEAGGSGDGREMEKGKME